MDEEIIQPAQHQRRAADGENDLVHLALGDVRADFHAEPAQHRAPDRRAEQREDGKRQVIHPRDAGGNADELPRARQQPRDEHARRAVMRHPVFAFLDFFRRDQNKFSVAQQQRPAGQPRQPVDNRRAEPRAERAGEDDGRQADVRSCPSCDQLAASGMMLSLGSGSTELSIVISRPTTQTAAGFERVLIPVEQRLEKVFQHGRWL